MGTQEHTSPERASDAGTLSVGFCKNGKFTRALAGLRESLAELGAGERHFAHLKVLELEMKPLVKSVASSALTQARDKKRGKYVL